MSKRKQESETGSGIAIPVIFLMILFSAAISAYYYNALPAQMASHWNFAGEVDGYMPKQWGVTMIPVIMVFMLALFFILPRIDPLKRNIDSFRKEFSNLMMIFFGFFLALHLMVISWSLGVRISFNAAMPILFAFMFYYVGVLLAKSKRNWFIGIRTPWTLSSDEVWEKTHKLGGKLFKVAGLIALAGVFAGRFALWFTLAPIIIFSLALVVYSYIEFKRTARKAD
jgi:uncharacterized membrane protein